MKVEERRPPSQPIELARLVKRFGNFVALDLAGLRIGSGEFLTLLGPSGSGKTTLLMVLAGFVKPDAGSIRFGGEEVILRPPHRRNVGMVFQNYALFPHMNVYQNVMFPLRLRRLDRKEADHRVRNALELVQLSGLEGRGINELSGGQQQRVAFARAIVFEPPILLMDEPLSALDKKLRETMQSEIRRLHETLGMTTVYVTHDQEEALALSDRVAVLNKGKIAQVGTPTEIFETPRDLFVAEFMGESTALPVEIRNGSVLLFGKAIEVSAPRTTMSRPHLILRPDRLEFGASEDRHSPNTIMGTVAQVIYRGETWLTRVALPSGHEILVKTSSQARREGFRPERGENVFVRFRPNDAVVVGEQEAGEP